LWTQRYPFNMHDETKKYSNGEVTIVWKPSKCLHSTLCWKGLGSVFNPSKRPWINAQGSDTQSIIEQVKKCPSGALSYLMNDETETTKADQVDVDTIIEVSLNGPLLVYGNIRVKDKDGNITRQANRVNAFCRCGNSSNKPYCDGTHRKVDFKG
jgi:uncharacterized Fe-S cluster protein YjdI